VRATAGPWLPPGAVTSPAFSSSGAAPSTRVVAPRALNEPVTRRHSSFSDTLSYGDACMRAAARRLGVAPLYGPVRLRAAMTSSSEIKQITPALQARRPQWGCRTTPVNRPSARESSSQERRAGLPRLQIADFGCKERTGVTHERPGG